MTPENPVRTRTPSAEDAFLPNILGVSPKMQRILRLVSRVATTESTVLLLGESGTGKELIARSIHVQSRRAAGPFVPVNLGAIPETLVESELFVHARGAFTGATSERRGLIEAADRGTLFLDEIGDMPTQAQVKLLRVLENGEVRRVGDDAARRVDVRVVAATHRDLLAGIQAGRFREDLYYRLNVVQIELPPLRERREDIGLLASYFLERAARREARGGVSFSAEAAALIERYDFPGNVRELENAVDHAVAVVEGAVIQPEDLPGAIRSPRLLMRGAGAAMGAGRDGGAGLGAAHVDGMPGGSADGESQRDEWSLADIEREHIRRVLARHRGNATYAARQLGISRTTLWRKLREYGLSRTG
ncbi:MAG: sigma 54-interacting transcriptional regulator [Candidatus Eisenbacteria bacterium]